MARSVFAITTGDPNGVGMEVTAKALSIYKHRRHAEFVVYGTKYKSQKWIKIIEKSANATIVLRDDPPALWVRDAAQGCLRGNFSALVTGPMSKNPTGHTEILAEESGSKLALMCFLGSKFHVLLATGHIALAQVPKAVTPERLSEAILLAQDLHKRLKLKKPIGVLGLNPHAGENGKISNEESMIFEVLSKFKKTQVSGPLVPDASFTDQNRSRFSIFVALYHDQGLIPFKALHGYSEGAQLTRGLPFVRTSVDHGTATDIFNSGRANPGSMLSALNWARRLT